MKHKANRLISFSTVAFFTLIFSSSEADELKETRTLSLDTNNITTLKIEAGAGFLVVRGGADNQEIKVTADLEVEKGNFELSLNQENETAVLVAKANLNNTSRWFGKDDKIDLTLAIPERLDVKISDGSGSIKLDTVNGNIDINDGSGSIEAKSLGGKVNIDDGSGSIVIKSAVGPIDINDGSGSLELSDIVESITINDGSGGMLVKNVKGHVTISDGSGSIELVNLDSGLTVLNDGSGSLSMENVNGKITK